MDGREMLQDQNTANQIYVPCENEWRRKKGRRKIYGSVLGEATGDMDRWGPRGIVETTGPWILDLEIGVFYRNIAQTFMIPPTALHVASTADGVIIVGARILFGEVEVSSWCSLGRIGISFGRDEGWERVYAVVYGGKSTYVFVMVFVLTTTHCLRVVRVLVRVGKVTVLVTVAV